MSLLLPAKPRHVAFGPAKQSVGVQRPCQPRRVLLVRSEPEGSEASSPDIGAQEASKDVCKTCGISLSSKPWGCDQDGRIIGGIGAVPGFGWWPIKAYRECPEAIKRGIQYRRKGQITDQVLFGRGKQ